MIGFGFSLGSGFLTLASQEGEERGLNASGRLQV